MHSGVPHFKQSKLEVFTASYHRISCLRTVEVWYLYFVAHNGVVRDVSKY